MNQLHKYKGLNSSQLEDLFSNYLINSFSYSKLMSFSRNEKGFEMSYIYREDSRRSATTVAGSAYHESLKSYFEKSYMNEICDLITLEKIAFDYIGSIPADKWMIQKTTPCIEKCKEKSLKISSSLLRNFVSELSVYESEIKEVTEIEQWYTEWITINGVDIPLPCNCVIDLVIKTIDDKIVIIDHKSKNSFSDEKDIKFSAAKQAMLCTLCYEANTGITVDEVWFIENKYSKNKNGEPQIKPFKIKMDKDTRILYESLIYEPTRRMLEAVSDPDYVYLINDSDNFADKAEMYNFWAKTMIAEVDDFNVEESKKELVSKRLKKIRDASVALCSPSLIKEFKKTTSEFITYNLSSKDMTNTEKIEHTLRSFGIITKVAHEITGYSSITYLLEVAAGTKISSIKSYRLDIANNLNTSNVRIMDSLVDYKGSHYLCIECSVGNEKTLYFDPEYLKGSKIPIGKDNFGNLVSWDIDNPSTPHVLIGGATGSGKSVSIRSTIEYAKLLGFSNIVIFDPKFEFENYSNQKNIDVYNDIEAIEEKMRGLVDYMNELVKMGMKSKTLVVFDEFADAVANSKKGNELKVYEEKVIGNYQNGMPKTKREHTDTLNSLEQNLKILLQKGRSSGFRIMAATQRASTKVITGDAKVNFPVQICFRVPKETDSRVMIDESGAESLSGRGDGIIKSPEYFNTIRFQGFFKAD